MKFQKYSPNPKGKIVGDCVIRAITKALENQGYNWDKTYCELCALGFEEADMPSSNAVWAKFLISKGFEYHDIMLKCLECYTIRDFVDEHQNDDYIYLIGTGDHVVTCINGIIYDVFNSCDMIPNYYFVKKYNNDKENSLNESKMRLKGCWIH